MRDVSERKRLEDQARDLYHQLLQAEKLAALGQTISGVAHELNNPLATILTWAERLSQRPVDEQTRRGLETILSESERAAKIVRNLLTFARKRHTTRAMVDLNQVVRETLALRSVRAARQQHHDVIEALPAGLPQRLRRPASDPAGPAQPDHQRRAGDDRRQRPRHAHRAHVARRRPRRRRARGERRRAGRAGGSAAEDLRSVLHDEGGRERHRARADRRVRHRAGAWRPDHGEVGAVRGRVVLRGAAGGRRHAEAAAVPSATGAAGDGRRRRRGARGRRRSGAGRGRRRSAARRRIRRRSRERRR